MSMILTMYNNKGGVSKTTTSFNLSVYLSKKLGKKVLIIDCDPQCNITELFFASMEVSGDDDSKLPGSSVYEALRPRFYGDQGRIDVSEIEIVQSQLYNNLFLLRGDFALGLAETYFGQACAQAITENVNEKQTYLVLRRLFRDLEKQHELDYIIVDVGPSVGALSRLAVISCDAFFVPTTPDRFCNQAISVLGNVVSDWIKRHDQIIKTFEPFGLETFPGKPIFMGAISQNFKAWGGKAKRSYAKWENHIAETLTTSFLTLPEISSPIQTGASPYVAQIVDVGPLAPVAQIFGRAIFDIQQEHSAEASTRGDQYYGAVWETWTQRMESYEGEMAKIAGALTND